MVLVHTYNGADDGADNGAKNPLHHFFYGACTTF